MPTVQESFGTINGVPYRLDLSGAVALFGGNYAIAALDIIHLYKGRRWLGWYNYPGMMDVARKYGQLADGPVWNTIFPGGEGEPVQVFGLGGKSGPKYAAFFSGTRIEQTSYLGYLLQQHVSRQSPRELELRDAEGSKARVSKPGNVTIVKLGKTRQSCDEPFLWESSSVALFGLIPTFVSIAAGVISGLLRDYVCAALIFSGMLSSGISTFFLGSAQLRFRIPKSDSAAPPADGLMGYNDDDLVILKGAEHEVNVVTRGEFALAFFMKQGERRHAIGITSVLLMIQFLAQLLLIQLATLFGQQMYLASLFVSGAYHLYMAAHSRERVQGDLFIHKVQPEIEKVTLGTRAQMAIFVCLASQDGQEIRVPYNEILKLIIPNDTAVWRRWRELVVAELETWRPEEDWTSFKHLDASSSRDNSFSGKDNKLYADLLEDAWCVFKGYRAYREKSKCKKDIAQLPA